MIDISVIIPVYGVEKYLQQCIDSLLNQTFKNIEYIFVNDASPDNSLKILLENQNKYPGFIKVVDLKENRKQGGARNAGLRQADGRYIGFVDSDDFAPNMYMDLFEKAEASGADVTYIQYAAVPNGIVYSNDVNWGQYSPIIEWNNKLTSLEGHTLKDKDICDLVAYQIGGVYCGLYRKDVLLSSNIVFPENLRYEDNYWSSLIKPSFRTVAFVHKIGYLYRQNPDSTLHQKNQSYHFRDRVTIEHMIIDDALSRGYFRKYYSAYEWGYIYRYVINTFHLCINNLTVSDDNLQELIDDLKKRFPKWWENHYFREQSMVQRIKYYSIIFFPKFTAIILSLRHK